MPAADTRKKIAEHLEAQKPLWQEIHAKSAELAALSVEYHKQSLQEQLSVTVEDGLVVAVLDIRQTPKSLDTTVSQIKMSGATGLRAFHDLKEGKIYVFKP